jgi:hypothetical protein
MSERIKINSYEGYTPEARLRPFNTFQFYGYGGRAYVPPLVKNSEKILLGAGILAFGYFLLNSAYTAYVI